MRKQILKRKTSLAVASGIIAGLVASLPATAGPRQTVTRPVNDDFTERLAIVELPFGNSVRTKQAGLEAGEPQPSCGETAHTVWYSYTAAEDVKLIAVASGLQQQIAVYTGTALGDLAEVYCSQSKATFDAAAGRTYHFQVGGPKPGRLEFQLGADVWRERVLLERRDVPVTIPTIDLPLVSVEGRNRGSDANWYDLKVRVGSQQIEKGVRTGVRLPQIGPIELVHVAGQTAVASVAISYRYDPKQRQCALDGGEGKPCDLALPVDAANPTWLTNEGAKAEMVVDVSVRLNGETVQNQTVRIPLVGQALSLLP